MALSKVDLANQVENQLPQGLVADNVPFRNIIINGDMSIAQRGTSQASAGSSAGSYDTVDRFLFAENFGDFTISQETDVPTGQGFAKSMKFDCTTGNASPATNGYLLLQQKVEGQNLQYLKKGTANAESVTISFWVKSNKTGTYILELDDNDNSRNINKSYTINTADTWEKKTITFAGDTTGAFGNDNGDSLKIVWWLGAGTNYTSGTLATSWESTTNSNRAVGQVNLADSTSNEFYITGVQLEAGTSASDFEFLPFDVNLQRCQRYYYLHASGGGEQIGNGSFYSSSDARCVVFFPTTMRSQPSIVSSNNTNDFRFLANGTSHYSSSVETPGGSNQFNNEAIYSSSLSGSPTGGHAFYLVTQESTALLAFNSEL